uniref:Protein m129.1 n=1 Tax=Mastomys natalensis cytomegalovirus 2 TaxID=2973540 RepID=A0A9Y1N7X2_9BETA|nr:protein m129.1 [Mastomys natalensis cytomegalovirus 2]WEG69258.1 protein m129.1 [Mastomys natalensis cytomegalovirus 2]WEG69397.1 protein m129.1 [Mastomys natalensis cytomegalovirus 2]WEG69535.1 protein m129.1 [Mastomys natalensis cytomegalovirus 2]WEG69673.1 protein m129.1 [Mastomys natalensis cytomegalovirus 2]
MIMIIKIILFFLLIHRVVSDCCPDYLEEIPLDIRTWGVCSDTEIMIEIENGSFCIRTTDMAATVQNISSKVPRKSIVMKSDTYCEESMVYAAEDGSIKCVHDICSEGKIFKSGTSQIILKCIDRGTSVQNPTKNIYLVDADVPIIEWSTQDDMQLINFNDYIKKVMRTKKIRQLSENECDMKLDLHAPPPETPVYCTETNE